MKNGEREKPILFSGRLVRAIIEGCKTQTRRVIKPQPNRVEEHLAQLELGQNITVPDGWAWRSLYCSDKAEHFANHLAVHCPYGQTGDKLWVREAHRFTGGGEDFPLQTVRFRASEDGHDKDTLAPVDSHASLGLAHPTRDSRCSR